MIRTCLACILAVASPLLAGSSPLRDMRPRPLITVPVRPPLPPRERPSRAVSRSHAPHADVVSISDGVNAVATGVRLASDFDAERGYHLVAEIANAGTSELSDLLIRFYLGDPAAGGVQIGGDLVLASVASGVVTRDSTHWEGFTGGGVVYAVVDPFDEVAETNEDDNRSSIHVSLRDDVPWVWQVVNGYCNYAGLTMQFNFLGCDHTLYETVEACSAPHSAIGIDDRFYLPGGLLICQSESDYVFAGTIRNLGTDMAFLGSWNGYLGALQTRIDAGLPCLTSVDPYYLPQPDYDVLRLNELHGGHAVVVTGYTDAAVVMNDPGVGLDFIDPGMPEPQKRGADVVVDLETFRQAVEHTSGAVYVLVSYSPQGPTPPEDEIMTAAFRHSIDRLAGRSYDPAWSGDWPLGWTPVFGMAAFDSLQDDMTGATFGAWFQEVLEYAGGNLEDAIIILASSFSDGMFWTKLGWEASQAYFSTLQSPEAIELAAAAGVMAARADAIFNNYIALLMTLMANGGNPGIAGPYLSAIAADLADINELEPQVRYALMRMLGMGGEGKSVAPMEHLVTASPNPFRLGSMIRWEVPGDAALTLGVYDVAGRLVRTLRPVDGHVVWDGTDTASRQASPGAYVIRDEAGRSLRLIRVE